MCYQLPLEALIACFACPAQVSGYAQSSTSLTSSIALGTEWRKGQCISRAPPYQLQPAKCMHDVLEVRLYPEKQIVNSFALFWFDVRWSRSIAECTTWHRWDSPSSLERKRNHKISYIKSRISRTTNSTDFETGENAGECYSPEGILLNYEITHQYLKCVNSKDLLENLKTWKAKSLILKTRRSRSTSFSSKNFKAVSMRPR